MNKLAVVITTSPNNNLTITALSYVESALLAGVEVIGVFFYQEGVMHANNAINIASDEFQAIKQWSRLHKAYNLPLHVCITAAEKRGIIGDDNINEANTETINDIFTLSGLGELVELSTNSTRMVQF
ncbi:MAG: sulfurtransferase complex subunit TusD [Colwellia sp.]